MDDADSYLDSLQVAGGRPLPLRAIMAELFIVAFFFAMRSCECTTTPTPGKTKTIDLLGILYRDCNKQIVLPESPDDLTTAEYVSFTFEEDQKKNDTRSQRRTNDPVLCPVWRAPASLVSRIQRLVPNHSATTPTNIIIVSRTILEMSQEFLRDRLRVT